MKLQLFLEISMLKGKQYILIRERVGFADVKVGLAHPDSYLQDKSPFEAALEAFCLGERYPIFPIPGMAYIKLEYAECVCGNNRDEDYRHIIYH